MKRLLCITSSMNTGGAETFLMKIYRQLDKTKFQMDFCVNVSENFYAEEIKKLGGKIFVVPCKSEGLIKSFGAVRKVVRDNHYEIVMRVNEHSLSVIDLIAAKMGGAKKLIMRSSNASSGSKKRIILHKLFQFLPIMVPNVKIAPSNLAAEYTFGKYAVRNNEVIKLHNGLDIDKFTFNPNVREQYRRELGVENKLVIGHVGRFNEQKNHDFLIDVFQCFHEDHPESILLLVGEGGLLEKIKGKVEKLGLSNFVQFLGVRNDIPQLLFAMDAFVFPSFYEGMPNTVIEAQTTGLPCLISDTISKESNVTGLVEFDSLKKSPKGWADDLFNLINAHFELRENAILYMVKSGYDIAQCAQLFKEIIYEVKI